MTRHNAQAPADDVLLDATLRYLETQLLPTLEGEHRFKTRLAVNALKTVQRGQNYAQADTKNVANIAFQQEAGQILARQIRERRVAIDDPALLAQLDDQLRQSLAVNNPKWLA